MIYHCQGDLTITPPLDLTRAQIHDLPLSRDLTITPPLDLTRAQIHDLPLSRGPNHYTTVRSDQGSNP